MDLYAGHPVYVTQEAAGVAFSPDGQRLASMLCGAILLWDRRPLRPTAMLAGHDDSDVVALSFSPDGARLMSCCWDGTQDCKGLGETKLWDLRSGKTTHTFDGHVAQGQRALWVR